MKLWLHECSAADGTYAGRWGKWSASFKAAVTQHHLVKTSLLFAVTEQQHSFTVCDWRMHLRNCSWKRSRCPCRVSAGRPEIARAAFLLSRSTFRNLKWVKAWKIGLFLGFYKSYRHAAWRGAWQWSDRGGWCPEWLGWAAPADIGLMWARWWRWSCWAGESLGQRSKKERTSCVRHLCSRRYDSDKIANRDILWWLTYAALLSIGTGNRLCEPSNILLN